MRVHVDQTRQERLPWRLNDHITVAWRELVLRYDHLDTTVRAERQGSSAARGRTCAIDQPFWVDQCSHECIRPCVGERARGLDPVRRTPMMRQTPSGEVSKWSHRTNPPSI